ncbi:DUF402 domain-containing protein [Ornithinibacillus caprae]|uniref:DUF402 domain-containing protein n=1 Tax=Ornithinibacillus caprae TaxID=2678566 RepID=UPI0031B5AC10
MKRKYGDRANWKRIIDRDYSQEYIQSEKFNGYITLLKMNKVKDKLHVSYGEKDVCIVDHGYSWLQQFPNGKHHSITVTFNEKEEIVQWYIDICLENGIENDIPWMDDLFLDIVVLPTGEIILLDEDELEEALSKGDIDHDLYQLAWQEVEEVLTSIKSGNFELLQLAHEHREILG